MVFTSFASHQLLLHLLSLHSAGIFYGLEDKSKKTLVRDFADLYEL